MGHTAGNLTVEVTTKQTSLALLFYDDEPSSWPSVYGPGIDMSCSDKMAKAKLPPGVKFVEPRDSGHAYRFELDVIQHLHPRYWYVALADCVKKDVSASYSLRFTNADGNALSYDQQGLVAATAIYLALWTVLLAAHARAVRSFVITNSYHVLVRLLTVAVLCEWCGVVANLAHYVLLDTTGVGSDSAMLLSLMLSTASTLAMLLLLMLIAKGWTISSVSLVNKEDVIVPFLLFLLSYTSLVLCDFLFRDRASTQYMYDSASGWIIVLLNIAMLAWFLHRISDTHAAEQHTEKRRFYLTFGASYAAWFLWLPLVVSFVTLFIQRYHQEAVALGLQMIGKLLAYAGLAVLFWPSNVGAYFQLALDQGYSSVATDSHPYDDL
eukprot:PLAT13198.1.p1 GENE.PLAT13198.1~~PLAT13198.1.p1  ORF type:complete len:436 (-),score=184.34 PLAT13198.1:96-1235(-)